jgi:RNA polymerase-interacting CarD/CdnL/TRCF family regulator
MCAQENNYSKGDWIVHAYHGIGQVKGKDKKTVEGEKQTFIRVEISDGQYWLPIANIDANYIRPLASRDQIKQALNLIRRPPQELLEDHKQRGNEISQILKDVSLYSTARLIRDLHGRRVSSKLNSNEENALKKMKKQFLNEWSVIYGEGQETLEKKLTNALKTGIQKSSMAED